MLAKWSVPYSRLVFLLAALLPRVGQRPAGSPQLRRLARELRPLLPGGRFETIPRRAKQLYFEATAGSRQDQLDDLSAELAAFSGRPIYAEQPLSDWRAAFAAFSELLERGQTMIVLDEFQLIARQEPEIGSLLNRSTCTDWSRSSPRPGSTRSAAASARSSPASPTRRSPRSWCGWRAARRAWSSTQGLSFCSA